MLTGSFLRKQLSVLGNVGRRLGTNNCLTTAPRISLQKKNKLPNDIWPTDNASTVKWLVEKAIGQA